MKAIRTLFRKWFRNISISYKMLLLYLLCVVILFTGFLVFFISFTTGYIYKSVQMEDYTKIQYGNTLIGKEQEYLISLSDYFTITSNTQELLRKSNRGMSYIPSPDFVEAITARKYLQSTIIYNTEGMPVFYVTADNSDSPVSIRNSSIFSKLMSGEITYSWTFIPHGNNLFMKRDYSPKLCLWKVIKDNRTMIPIGVIAVAVDTRKLLSTGTPSQSLYDSLIILDDEGTVAFHSTLNNISLSEESCRALADYVYTEQLGNRSGNTEMVLDGTRYMVTYCTVSATNLCTFVLSPINSIIWSNNHVAVYAIIGILVSILLSSLVFVVTSHWITKPVRVLARSMEQFSEANNYPQVSITGDDEIGRLGRSFNDMVVKQKHLIETQHDLLEKNYASKIREQEAELNLRMEQINPHFLYNVLHSIQWIAIDKGIMDIANISHALAMFIRVSLNRGNNVVTLKDEFNIVHFYLYLQNYQFPDQISCDIDNDPYVMDAKVPKLIVQPLLENSIVHGKKDQNTPLHLSVSCKTDSERKKLVILCTDDGKGFDPDILPYLPNQLDGGSEIRTNSKFALKNIDVRLRLMYHDQYSFRFDNMKAGGAKVRIEVPLQF